jgi:multidrug efflux pump subunit AcrA (membrane-fusion protein)
VVTLGQAVERATDAFKIANLTQLWVLLELYEKDLAHVHVGQRVELRTEALGKELLPGSVAYVEPTIDEKTRTTNVRIVFANPTGKLRPGQFVTARLIGDPRHAGEPALAVSRRAVQSVDGKRVVFVRAGDGFERRTAQGGRRYRHRRGLPPQERAPQVAQIRAI